MKQQIKMLFDKKLIRPSSSPYGAPVFFVKKKNKDLRMVCDYRALSKITIPDEKTLSLIDEAIDQVPDAIIFSQFNLIGAMHTIKCAYATKTAKKPQSGIDLVSLNGVFYALV